MAFKVVSDNIAKKKWSTKLLFALLLGIFLILQIFIVSSIAQTSNEAITPLYGKMEKLLCGEEIGIKQLKDEG